MSKRGNLNFPPTLTADDLDREREQILQRMKSAREQEERELLRPTQRSKGRGDVAAAAAAADDRTVFTEGGYSQITDLKAAAASPQSRSPYRGPGKSRGSGGGPPPAASSGYGRAGTVISRGSLSRASDDYTYGSGNDQSTVGGPGQATVVGAQSAVGSFLMKAPWEASRRGSGDTPGAEGGGGRRGSGGGASKRPRGGANNVGSDTSAITGLTGSVVRQAANYVYSAQEGSKRLYRERRRSSDDSGGSGRLSVEEEEERQRMRALAAAAGSANSDPRQSAARDRVERLSREVGGTGRSSRVVEQEGGTGRGGRSHRRGSSSGAGGRRPLHTVDEDGFEDQPSKARPSRRFSNGSSSTDSGRRQSSPSRRDRTSTTASRARSQQSQRNFADRRPQNLPPIGQKQQQQQHQISGQRSTLSAPRSPPLSSRNTGGASMAPSTYHAPSFGTNRVAPQQPPPSGPLPMAAGSAAGQDGMREYISPEQLQNRKILLGITVLVSLIACGGFGWLMVSRKMSVYSDVVPGDSVGDMAGEPGGSSTGTATSAGSGAGGGSDYSSREAGLKEILRGLIEPRDAFDDGQSPQTRALRWLVYDDPMQLEPPSNTIETSKLAERFALTVLYYATGGENWASSHSFLSGQDVCEWNSVDDRGYFSGAGQCDRDNMVTTLALWQNNLSGRIPAELASLRKLKVLSLYRNKLKGQVPGRLSQLSDIHTLYLHDNELSGTVDHMCSIDIQNFRSDCYDDQGRGTQMVICSCCNVCCNRDRQCFQV